MARDLAGRTRRAGEGLRARVRGAGVPDARRLLREERPVRRRRVPPGPEARRRVLRREAARRRSRAREKRAALAASSRRRSPRPSRALKEKGFESPYLRAFVVARINPLRFQRGAKADFDETIEKMLASAKKFKPESVKAEQLARAGGAAGGVRRCRHETGHVSDPSLAVSAILARPRGGRRERAGARTSISRRPVVDLTHAFDEKTIYWPTSPSAFELTKLADGRRPAAGSTTGRTPSARRSTAARTSTRRRHFAKDGRTADQIPLRQLVAPGRRHRRPRSRPQADADYRLTLADVRAWEKRHGADPGRRDRAAAHGLGKALARPEGATSATTRRATRRSCTSPRTGRRPRSSSSRERQVGALGVDTASIDYGASKDFIVHRHRQRRQRPGPREPREPRGAAGDRAPGSSRSR